MPGPWCLRTASSVPRVEGNDGGRLRAIREDELPFLVDVGAAVLLHGQPWVGAETVGAVAADAHQEVRTLEDVLRPRIRVHREPLRGQVVAHEEAGTYGREDRQE